MRAASVCIILLLSSGCGATDPLTGKHIGAGSLMYGSGGATLWRHKFLAAHPDTQADIKSAIEEGRVINGMSQEEVTASWGPPANAIEGPTGAGWMYESNMTDEVGPYKLQTIVRFKPGDGKVWNISQKKLRGF